MTAEHAGTGFDRAFPFLTGLGVAIAFLLSPWVPPLKSTGFPLYALLIAIPAGTLRLRGGRVAWLGVRHGLAAGISVVLAAWLPVFVGNVLLFMSSWFIVELPSVVDKPAVVVLAAMMGLLTCWFALQFQRWAARSAIPPTKSHWDPRSWGAAGVAGGTVSLFSATILAWLILVAGPELIGPNTLMIVSYGFLLACAALLGLLGLVVEAVLHRARTRRLAKATRA